MERSVEVAVDEDQRGHQGPDVEGDADPAGGDLHPHRGPLARHGLVLGVGAEAHREREQEDMVTKKI